MFTKTVQFLRGNLGKCLLYLLMFSTLYMGYGCAYHQVAIPKEEFMNHKKIRKDVEDYSFYVHDGSAVYKMESVQLIQGRDISGKLTATQLDTPKKEWKTKAKRDWDKAHRYDVHLYAQDHANLAASLQEENGIRQGTILLKDAMIREIQVMAVDVKRSFSVGNIFAGVMITLLVAVIVAGIVDSSQNGSESGTSDSGS
jgi:hypothetical protein